MSFHDIRLPYFIACNAKGGPEFSTSCALTSSGREIRVTDQYEARQKYFINNCRVSLEQFAEFNAFFRARGGQTYSFRFKDYADYKVDKQQIKYVADGKLELSLFKIYNDQFAPYFRRITKPIASTIKIFSGQNIIEPAEINVNNGSIILSQPISAAPIWTIEFEFDVEVRFNKDNFHYNNSSDGTIEIESLELIEVLQ